MASPAVEFGFPNPPRAAVTADSAIAIAAHERTALPGKTQSPFSLIRN
jgi:hypothetical protein